LAKLCHTKEIPQTLPALFAAGRRRQTEDPSYKSLPKATAAPG